MSNTSLSRRIGYYVILVGFLVYGGIRAGGGLAAFAQAAGWWDTEIGRKVVETVASSLPEMSGRAFVPLSVEGYIAWSATMGIVLTAGSLLALFKVRGGYLLMGVYFVLFGMGFMNYMVLNVKLLHFAASLFLFLLMVWLSNIRLFRMQSSRTNG